MTCKKNCECCECTDFISSSSVYGLKEFEFSDLPDKQKIKLKRLMARIMERAYRRGVQQAITLYQDGHIPDSILNDLYSWRYGNDLDESIGIDYYKTTSVERLDMEEQLYIIGL